MNCEIAAAEAVVRPAVQARLKRVFGTVFFLDGEFCEGPPIDLCLIFEGGTTVHLSCCTDGETMRVDGVCPLPLDMEESGEYLVRDFSKQKVWRSNVGSQLTACARIMFRDTGKMGGLRFWFGGGGDLTVLNLGDELCVSEGYPPGSASQDAEEFSI